MKRCPSCSRTYPDTVDQFCPFDGAPLLTEGSGTIYDSKAGIQPPPSQTPAPPPSNYTPPMPTMMAPPPISPSQQPSLSALNNDPFGQPPPQQQQPGVWMPPPPPAFAGEGPMSNFSAPGGRNQMAVASFATSLFGLLCCQIASPVALVLGFMAYSQFKANPAQEGKGFATAGIIISSISLVLTLLYIIFVVIAGATS